MPRTSSKKPAAPRRKTAARKPALRGAYGGARWLKVRVTDTMTGKAKATVNLPLGLVDAGLNIASQYAPDVAFDQLIEAINEGAQGKIIDVLDEEDGEHKDRGDNGPDDLERRILPYFLGLRVALPAVADHEVDHHARIQKQECDGNSQDEEERVVCGT